MSNISIKVYNLIMIVNKLDDLIWQYRTTAKDIHIKTGISEATLSNMRNNSTTRYDAKTLDLLCKYFNCKVSDLLEFTPD